MIIDSHVHIYDCTNVSALLDAAYSNISAEAQRQGASESFVGILMLTETAAANCYQVLAELAANDPQDEKNSIGQWKFSEYSDDKIALLAVRNMGESLILVAGRQIITEEGMEVLALVTTELFNDGQPLLQVVEHVRKVGAVPVIPWAVGKWLGRRGKYLRDFMKRQKNTGLLLGDNGGRPVFWRNLSHFKLARESGMKILPGSDPLPLSAEINRVGSYGFILHQKISDLQPAHDLKQLLLDPDIKVHHYGNLQKTSLFIKNQLGIRLQK